MRTASPVPLALPVTLAQPARKSAAQSPRPALWGRLHAQAPFLALSAAAFLDMAVSGVQLPSGGGLKRRVAVDIPVFTGGSWNLWSVGLGLQLIFTAAEHLLGSWNLDLVLHLSKATAWHHPSDLTALCGVCLPVPDVAGGKTPSDACSLCPAGTFASGGNTQPCKPCR